MNTLTDAELLVLDDLGAGWTINGDHEVMGFIIGARHEERLPTIFTSNHQFRAQGPVREIGNDRYSRLREMCEIIGYDGADYRAFGYDPSAEELTACWAERNRPGGAA